MPLFVYRHVCIFAHVSVYVFSSVCVCLRESVYVLLSIFVHIGRPILLWKEHTFRHNFYVNRIHGQITRVRCKFCRTLIGTLPEEVTMTIKFEKWLKNIAILSRIKHVLLQKITC